jgi:ATP-binding protein involved in chromosome partitioning
VLEKVLQQVSKPKSYLTSPVNLAIAISSAQKRVALLDADIYGPSIPMLMNLEGKPEVTDNKLMVPLVNYGIKCMSMGFLVEKDSPIIWRGLMVFMNI